MISRCLIPVGLALALVTAATAGCGNGSQRRTLPSGNKIAAPKLAAVKPAAIKEFDAAMRSLGLGGPEAATRAKERFRAAVDIDGTLWEAWHNLGTLAFDEGDDEAAIEAF